MQVDERVRELPLGTCDLQAVPLQCGLAGASGAEILALADELRNLHRKLLGARTAATPPEAGRPQRSHGGAASHEPFIGTGPPEV